MLRAPLLLGALAALIIACGSPLRMDGAHVQEQYGRLVVDDIVLEFSREVPVQGELSADAISQGLTLGAHTGDIELVGGPASKFEFVVTLQTEIEGDGVVELKDGMLRARSLEGGKCVINGMRGRVPQGINLDLLAGSGRVILSRFQGVQTLNVESGVGAVQLEDVKAETLTLRSGTGNVQLVSVKGNEANVDLGVGSLLTQGCELAELRARSSTGAFVLRESRVHHGSFHSGTGNLQLVDSHVGNLERSLGTGEVIDGSLD
ncbi:MAG: hypothetical protein DHS20C15_02290 [Planctomycetota bacterium]|nr:MAG: hypothetical protein DHS20C15_02290 [Planctomycetota bacterium]